MILTSNRLGERPELWWDCICRRRSPRAVLVRCFQAVAHRRPLEGTRSTRERGHPARSVRAIAARKAGRMPALPDIFKAAKNPRNYRFSELRRLFLPVTAA